MHLILGWSLDFSVAVSIGFFVVLTDVLNPFILRDFDIGETVVLFSDYLIVFYLYGVYIIVIFLLSFFTGFNVKVFLYKKKGFLIFIFKIFNFKL